MLQKTEQWIEPESIDSNLPKNTVVLWLAHLEDFFPYLAFLRGFLHKTEIEKADRFHFDIHKKRYAVSQSLLRFLLANYLSLAPQDIQFASNAYGKPFVAQTPIHFNISHSNAYALYAFSADTELGVDIESWRERKYFDGIIDSNFSEMEQAIYYRVEERLKTASFYQGWTCNEAYIKAIGMGLSFPLQDFSVEMNPTQPAKLLEAKPKQNIKTEWHLQMLPCPANYSAALATEHSRFALQFFNIVPACLFEFLSINK